MLTSLLLTSRLPASLLGVLGCGRQRAVARRDTASHPAARAVCDTRAARQGAGATRCPAVERRTGVRHKAYPDQTSGVVAVARAPSFAHPTLRDPLRPRRTQGCGRAWKPAELSMNEFAAAVRVMGVLAGRTFTQRATWRLEPGAPPGSVRLGVSEGGGSDTDHRGGARGESESWVTNDGTAPQLETATAFLQCRPGGGSQRFECFLAPGQGHKRRERDQSSERIEPQTTGLPFTALYGIPW
eukprot:scaffold39782_cov82-Phaeocystis_antarctica.AAC.4